MSILTTIKCDYCGKKLDLGAPGDAEVPGAETILEVNDANSIKTHYCGIAHLRAWAATYSCPYRKSTVTPARSKKIIEPFDE